MKFHRGEGFLLSYTPLGFFFPEIYLHFPQGIFIWVYFILLTQEKNSFYQNLLINDDTKSFMTKIKEIRVQEFGKILKRNKENVAGAMVGNWENIKYKNITCPSILGLNIGSNYKRLIQRWLLGMICTHQECSVCKGELSRKDGVKCSGIQEIILRKYPNLRNIILNEKESLIDLMISQFREKRPVKQDGIFIGKIIKIVCLL